MKRFRSMCFGEKQYKEISLGIYINGKSKMTTISKLPFINGWKIELSKLPNYDHFKGGFTEQLDWHLLKLIYESPFLESRPEIKANVKNLIEKTVRKTGEVKVTHNQRYKCGRFYADDNISLIPLSRYVKHTVFKYLGWLDIDMVKGHPSIAIEMGKLVGLSLPAFENYVNKFDDIVKTLSDFYSVEGEKPLGKDNIKWLFNSMIYGGGFANWVKGIVEGDENYEATKMRNETTIHPIIASFKKECVEIMNKIYKENPSLAKKVAEKKDDVYAKKCSVCSYWFQIIENHLVYAVAEHLLNCGILQPKSYGLEYDGLCIPPHAVFYKDQVIKEINDLILLTTGLNITFKFKDYDEDHILHDLIETRRNMVIEDVVDEEVQVEESKMDETEQALDDIGLSKSLIHDMDIPDHVVKVLANKKSVVFMNDDGCGNYIYKLIKNDVICCNNQIFIKVENVWYNNSDYLNTYLTNFVMNQNILRVTPKGNRVLYWKDYNRAVNVVKTVINRIKLEPKNDLYELFHSTTKGRLCFLDGVLDFQKKMFYLWSEVDFPYYSTVQIKLKFHNYFHNPNMVAINEIKEKIFIPLFNSKVDMALKFFARSFAGHCEDKNFATYIGNRDCGKGILFELFEAFDSYLKALSLDNILCSRFGKIDAKKSVEMFWLLEFEFCRLAFSQETPKPGDNLKVNPSLFKKLVSGGDIQTARRNYDRQDTVFKVDFTPFLAGNNSLDLEGDLNEHLIEFDSFVQFLSPEVIISKRASEGDFVVDRKYRVKDPSLKDKCHTLDWKLAVIYLIYSSYVNTALPTGIVNTEMEETTTLLGQFSRDYEITGNMDDIVPVSEIKGNSYGRDWKKLKIELEGMGVIVGKCHKSSNDLRNKICCFGIRKVAVETIPPEGGDIEEIS